MCTSYPDSRKILVTASSNGDSKSSPGPDVNRLLPALQEELNRARAS
ncbi:MAG TPA: hypothetical protein PLK28_20465 [Candidatus Rifleibacterium sp.]|nr:hypothetical protein [Candidatus Rifleibacterium sp.]HOI92887.1 hypothetical protein [Candidatus Rifleibacterium sp.]HQB84348.1 hypothetical protein [Candidatus Rifleibacterium sp.]